MRIALREITTPLQLAQLRRAIDAYSAKMAAEARPIDKMLHFGTFMGCWQDYLELAPDEAPDVRGPHERALDEYQAARERVRAGRADARDHETVAAWERGAHFNDDRAKGATDGKATLPGQSAVQRERR
jgi:hypothetical protein